MASTTCCMWIDISGEAKAQLHEIAEQTTWLKKVTASKESFFTVFNSDWLGS